MPQRNTIFRMLAISCLLAAAPVFALDPDLHFYQYDFEWPREEIDLPGEIYGGVQDADGALWLATALGLVRYDGLEYVPYRVASYPNVLSNKPTRLFMDSRNRLFVASARGLSLYEDGQFRVLMSGNKWDSEIHAFAEDDAGVIWLGTEGGLWQLVGNKIQAANTGSETTHVRSLYWDGSRMIVGVKGGVHVIDDSVATVLDLPPEFASSEVRDIAYFQEKLWLATRQGMLTLSGAEIAFFDAPELANIAFEKLIVDSDGSLWFLSIGQVGRVFASGEIEVPDVTDSLTGAVPELTDIFEDRSGRVWQTSLWFGLAGLKDTPITRVSYTQGLASPIITAIADDAKGAVFVATDKGISRVAGSEVARIADEKFPPGRSVRTMFKDSAGVLWVGAENGIRRHDLAAKTWLPPLDNANTDIPVNDIVEDPSGRVWIATDAGLLMAEHDQVHAVLGSPDQSVEALLVDSSGTLWLGTENGVATMTNDVMSPVSVEAIGSLEGMVSLKETPSGAIVAATADQGIGIFDGKSWFKITEADGLPSEQVLDVDIDREDLIVVTGSGVFRVSVSTDNDSVERAVSVEPVVASSRYRSAYSAHCCRGQSGNLALVTGGKIVAATVDGIISFDKNLSTETHAQPRPYLKSVRSAERQFETSAINGLKLTAENNEVQISYSAIALVDGDKVRFRYRLLGFSSEWVDVGSARTVHIHELPPGDYSFELQASSQPDAWSSDHVGFSFSRVPKFTETKLFYMTLWLAIALISGFLLWHRTRAVQRNYMHIQEQIRERTAALNELNRELRTNNQALQKSSQTDPLTGLINRRYFDDSDGDAAIPDAIADRGVLMALDIDFFKRVNDAYGHEAGDEVLRQFSSVLRSCTRQSDLVARWGGEEFIIICQCPNDDAPAMLERINTAVRDHQFSLATGKILDITCSIGSVRYPLGPDLTLDVRLSTLMEFADAALYVVKMSGRDGWALLEAGAKEIRCRAGEHIEPALVSRIEANEITWLASRPTTSPVLDTTVSRLHTIYSR